jgi:transglutaminase-like putative cysteine protease
MMSAVLRLPLLILILALAAAVRAHPPAPVPAFVVPVPVDLDSLPPSDQAGSGVYWLLTDYQDRIAASLAYGHLAVKVLSEAGLSQASEIALEYAPDFEEVRWHRVTLWRDGKPRELLPSLKPTELRREEGYEWGLLDGRRTQIFNLEDVRVGDVIEQAYTLEGGNPILAGRSSEWRWFRFATPVERVHYRVLHPPGRPLFLAFLQGAPRPVEGTSGGEIELRWDLRKTGTSLTDDDAPAWFDPDPRVQWSEYRTWGEVVDWALGLYRVEGPLSPALEAEAARLRGLEPKERIRRALRLVQDEVRYLGLEMGVSSHRPNHPSRVYARRFGDCKDKALLFCALLGRAGVEAVPVLVNTRAQASVREFQPSPLAFDHVIARVWHAGRFHYLDPTASHQRGDPLASEALDYGLGLPVAEGASGFDTIAPGEAGGGIEMTQVFVLPRLDTSASLEVTSVHTGAEADRIRAYFATESREGIRKAYLNYYAAAYPGIRVTSALRYEDDTSANVVTVREAYAVDSLCGARDGGRPACRFHPQEIAHWVAAPDRRIRSSPYALDYPKHVVQTLEVALPEPPDFDPDQGEVAREEFRFAWKSEVRDGRARLRYEYLARAGHVPLERFPDYLAALDTVADNLGMTLYPAGSSPLAPGGRLNHFLVLVLGLSLAAGVWAARRLRRLRTARMQEPGIPPREFNGVLWFLGLFLILRTLSLFALLAGHAALFDLDAWTDVTAPGGSEYHPLNLPLLLLGFCGATVLLCCEATVLPLFFRRRKTFPKAFLVTMAAYVLMLAAVLFGYSAVAGLLEGKAAEEVVRGWIEFALVAAAFMLYVAYSKRARRTFVFPLPEVPEPARAAQPTAPVPGSRSVPDSDSDSGSNPAIKPANPASNPGSVPASDSISGVSAGTVTGSEDFPAAKDKVSEDFG